MLLEVLCFFVLSEGIMDRFRKRLKLVSFVFVLVLMTFGSHGSFNPAEVGFYTSIGAGILFHFLTLYGFRALIEKRIKK